MTQKTLRLFMIISILFTACSMGDNGNRLPADMQEYQNGTHVFFLFTSPT